MARIRESRGRNETGRYEWSQMARAWVRWEPVLMHALSAVDLPLIRAIALEPGQRVVDFGCGLGEPTLTIARYLEPGGGVLGVDIAAPMLAAARRRAHDLGIKNARFERADMESFRARGRRFDAATSRFGIMFVEDVSKALAAVRGCLKPGGRVALAVWGPADRNPGYRLRHEAERPFLKEPMPDPETSRHPMRLARRGLLARLMRRAGFRDVTVRPVPVSFVYTSAVDCARLWAESSVSKTYDSLSARDKKRLFERLRRAALPFEDEMGVRIPGLAWVVAGRR